MLRFRHGLIGRLQPARARFASRFPQFEKPKDEKPEPRVIKEPLGLWESMSKPIWRTRHDATLSMLQTSNKLPTLEGVCEDPEEFTAGANMAVKTVLEQLGAALGGETPRIDGLVTPELREKLVDPDGDLSWFGKGIAWSLLKMKPLLLNQAKPHPRNPFRGIPPTFDVSMIVETREEYKSGADVVHVERHYNVTFQRTLGIQGECHGDWIISEFNKGAWKE
mmetsp:Transcript_64640/g.114982  ORF Transcript_64640/g.114982 Transcript_64640/m.114982 type:complete len:222 (+) Transcript_64640:93-758(+)